MPELRTPRLLLRPFRASDAPEVYRYASDPRVARFMRFATHRSPAESRRAIRMMTSGKHYLAWAITLRGNGELIGSCGFLPPQREHGRAELGYWLGPPHWGRGYATEAVGALLGYGFDRLGLNRIEAMCMPQNPASARVLIKAGMRYEGLLRQFERIKGRYRDMQMYSILRVDWTLGGKRKPGAGRK